MNKSIAELLVATLYEIGARQIFGVVGDALNPFTDAIRRHEGMQWIGVRHEEGAALAAAGQAKLTGKLAVYCGTTGPGANHLIAGLYEAHKDHAPVLAISGGIPAAQRGNDYLQENTPALLFRDVTRTIQITNFYVAEMVITVATERQLPSKLNVRTGCAPCKGGAFQWVQAPSGKLLQPETTGATMEVTKWLKPSGKERHDIW